MSGIINLRRAGWIAICSAVVGAALGSAADDESKAKSTNVTKTDAAADDRPPYNLPLKTSGGNQVWTDVLIYQGWRIQHNVVLDYYRLLDSKDVRQAWGELDHCRKKFDEIRKEKDLAAPRGKAVVVVHGLWRSRDAMEPICKHLREEGHYHVVNFGYASTRQSIGEHAAHLTKVIDNLSSVEELNFVGCSLGNLVIRRYLADREVGADGQFIDKRIKRCVMLAPPNQGAQIARRFAGDPVVQAAWGVPGKEIAQWEKLAKTLGSPRCEFGILAGGKTHEKGGAAILGNPLIDGDDDYLISVEETKLDGAADFAVLPVSHASIKRDATAAEYTLRFLEKGYFVSAEKRHPLPEKAK